MKTKLTALLLIPFICSSVAMGRRPAPTPRPRPSPTVTATAKPSPTATFTPTATAKPTATFSPTATATATLTPTATVKPTPTATLTPTPTATVAPTPSATFTPTPTSTASVAPASKPWTYGVISLLATDPDKQGHPLNLDDYAKEFGKPTVTTLGYRGLWSVAAPSVGTYKFDTLDDLFARAKAGGQRVGFSFSGGCTSPPWIGAATYTTKDGKCTMPLPWSSQFKSTFFAFVKQMSAKYSSNDTLAYVRITGFWQQIMTLIGDLDDKAALDVLAKEAGYTGIDAAVIENGKLIIDEFAKDFPTTSVMLMTTRFWPDTSGQDDYKALVDYGTSKYPNFGVMPGNGLKCQSPPLPAPLAINFPKIAQANWWVTGLPCADSYIGTIPSDCSGSIAVGDLLGKAVSDGDQAVEMYRADIEPDGNQSVLAAKTILLKANVPAGHK